jgi:hypothetical protein
MKAKITIAAVFAFAGLRASGSDLPQAAEKIVQQFESDQVAARKRAMAELETVKNVELRRGNSVGVNAIQAKIKELNTANAAALAAPSAGAANVPAAAGTIT